MKAPRTITTPATNNPTPHLTLLSQLFEAMIDQGVAAALATCDANRSTNGEDNHNSGTGVRRTKRVAREQDEVSGDGGEGGEAMVLMVTEVARGASGVVDQVFISFKVGLHYLLAKVVPVGMYRDLSPRTSGPLQDPTTATITTITITNDEGMQRVRTLRETISPE
ncbi:hypothetical protein Tco_0340776 [Tanacetum coccineum]